MRLVELMGAEQHEATGVASLLDNLVQFMPAGGIEAGGGFVEHEQVRLVDKRQCECEPLLLTTGECIVSRVGLVGQTQPREQLACVGVRAVERREETQCLARSDLVL